MPKSRTRKVHTLASLTALCADEGDCLIWPGIGPQRKKVTRPTIHHAGVRQSVRRVGCEGCAVTLCAYQGLQREAHGDVRFSVETPRGMSGTSTSPAKQELSMATANRAVVIKPANIRTAIFKIRGTAPMVQARFSGKAMQAMMAKMALGSQSNKGRAKAARDFDDDLEQAKHISTDGWQGIPASAFRQAMISACRLVGFKMTLAKLSVFVQADGFDRIDGIPLIRFEGTPERTEMAVRNATGVADIRIRPMWREWTSSVRVSFDADQFSIDDVTNLMARVGLQVGIGEGRPDSRDSAGLGWGTFELVN